MKNKIYIFAALVSLAAAGFYFFYTPQIKPMGQSVYASFATPPSQDGEDHVDDPAIYVNKQDSSKSFVVATNKTRIGGGLHLYDLEGKELDFIADGRMNNVDIRYDFPLGGQNKIPTKVFEKR